MGNFQILDFTYFTSCDILYKLVSLNQTIARRGYSLARYEIRGGATLNGSVTISGAKNAVVAILPAALLVNGPCRIENVPDISDVRILLDIL